MSIVRSIACLCAAVCALSVSARVNGQVEFLKQNWNDATRQLFYTTSQGSRMLPYDWFVALEVGDGRSSFVKTRMQQLGYIPNDNTLANPDRLPVGFVADVDWSGRKYVGMNCSACHTSRIQFRGKTYQVDGAPTLADIWGLFTGIQDALNATATQESKFTRFARNVLGPTSAPSDVADLRNELNDFRSHWNQFLLQSTPDPTGRLKWGRGRLDAFGMIFNRVSSIDLEMPENSSHPNAPVSYPFLWGTSFEDRVQWNASAPNDNDIERLGRNVGEVLGVFGAADLQKASILRPYYRTSARRLSQVRMENWLKTLWSPVWPTDFPPIDPAKKEAGKALFGQHCAGCHQVIEHGKQNTPVKVGQIPVGKVGTDNRMALNAITRMAKTGRLEGSRIPPDLQPLPAKMPTGALLVHVVQGAVISPFHDVDTSLHGLLSLRSRLLEAHAGSIELTQQEIQEFMQESETQSETELLERITAYSKYISDYNRQLNEFIDKAARDGLPGVKMESNPYVYKARPLDGVWATAPYLHNGSVPNLHEMLLPAERRTKVFHIGNPEYDPMKVGFKTDAGSGTTEFDTHIEGNLNAGHDQYGERDFTEDQRLQLLEYLKSL